MIRKLYSKNKYPEDDIKAKPKYVFVNGSNAAQTLYGNLDKRASFDYSWWQFWKTKPCCCRRKLTREDKLFAKARIKLHAEIDLLQIIKQLRLFAFTSKILLKPHQPQLVKWFDEYNIKVKEEENVEFSKAIETLDLYQDEDTDKIDQVKDSLRETEKDLAVRETLIVKKHGNLVDIE